MSYLQRITNNASDVQDIVIEEYDKNDILGIKRNISQRTLLEDLLWPLNVAIPHPIQVKLFIKLILTFI